MAQVTPESLNGMLVWQIGSTEEKFLTLGVQTLSPKKPLLIIEA